MEKLQSLSRSCASESNSDNETTNYAEDAILTFGNISEKDFDALVADLARKAGISCAAGLAHPAR